MNKKTLLHKCAAAFAKPNSAFIATAALVLSAQMAHAQGGAAGESNLLTLVILSVAALLAFMTLLMSDRILKMTANKVVMEKEGKSNPEKERQYGLVPTKEEFQDPAGHPITGNAAVHKLTKGHEIRIAGKAKKIVKAGAANTYSVKPIDFNGLKPIPKMVVEVGSEVKAGDHLFFDKTMPEVFFTAPVSGEVVEIRRGEKRAITEVVILGDKEQKYREFAKHDTNTVDADTAKAQLLDSGAWTFFTERPFGVIANLNEAPKAIHISTFNTAPLAGDLAFQLQGKEAAFQAGLNVLAKLTDQVHLNLDASAKSSAMFKDMNNAQINYFEGAHPAGNVGIQIHHVDPINKGDAVWTIKAEDVATIGTLFTEGKMDTSRKVAVAGPVLKEALYIDTFRGANVEHMVKDNLEMDNVRVISGDVLTGREIGMNGHLGFNDTLVSVIEEGDFYEFMGWLLPSYARPSVSPTFPWMMTPFYDFDVNTNTHGEQRAFVVTGQYEEVLPMEVYPVHLLKAIISNDFDQMEGLGIYEVLEEDLALCEFVCTSKQPVQQILRDGLDYMREQV